MSPRKTKTEQIQKLPFSVVWQMLGMLLLQSVFGIVGLMEPRIASAAETFDKDTYDTLLEESDKRIKDMKKKRMQRDLDRLKEEAEDRKSDDLRQKRPVFGSRKVASDDSDDSDENKNKIFATSEKKRDRDRQMNVTIRLDVDDDDQLESMKADPVKKKDIDEDKELAKRREERKEAFDDLTDKPYYTMDWVPSPPDGTSNGGFGLLNGNGRPVPYHLNGHPNLQRGMPWDLDD
jgi:hypothetical protein